MTRNSFIFSEEKELCTGCGACTQVCSHHALTMKADEEGFLYPSLDSEKCIACGVCEKTCPVVNSSRANADYIQKGYVATTKEERYYKESASIGICTMLSEMVVKEGGIVYGSYLDESIWNAYHIGVTDVDGIVKIRNSKYCQSDTKKTYEEVKDNLRSGRRVLYIGTPCQIAGLKAFLHKDYSNLLLVDIICHGVFSPKLMPLEVRYWEEKFNAQLRNFKFRSKRIYKIINGGMVNFDVQLPNGSLRHIERHASASPSYRAYAYSGDGNSYNIRFSCYKCPFRDMMRYGDITVGDPWFITSEIHNEKLRASNSVRSIFSINSTKGEEAFAKIQPHIIFEQMSMEKMFAQPAVKQVNRAWGGVRLELYKRIEKEEYALVIEDLLHCNLDNAHKRFVWDYRKIQIKRIIRLVLNRIKYKS